MSTASILVVDSDPAIRDLLGELLCDEGYQVRLLEQRELCPHQISVAPRPDLLLLEITPRAGAQTMALVEQLRRLMQAPLLPVIVCTTDPRQVEQLGAELGRLGCAPLVKPFDLEQLVQLIRDQLGRDGAPARAASPQFA
jgi:two-component system nitrogen regulation response regulator NtrX